MRHLPLRLREAAIGKQVTAWFQLTEQLKLPENGLLEITIVVGLWRECLC